MSRELTTDEPCKQFPNFVRAEIRVLWVYLDIKFVTINSELKRLICLGNGKRAFSISILVSKCIFIITIAIMHLLYTLVFGVKNKNLHQKGGFLYYFSLNSLGVIAVLRLKKRQKDGESA